MRTLAALAFLFLAAAGLLSAPTKQDKTKDDQDKLVGAWKIESFINKGDATDAEDLKEVQVVVTADKLTIKQGDNTSVYTYRLDASKTPKTIDTECIEGMEKGKKEMGIYELDGDTFKLCSDDSGKTRPKEFESKSDTEMQLLVMKRVKP